MPESSVPRVLTSFQLVGLNPRCLQVQGIRVTTSGDLVPLCLRVSVKRSHGIFHCFSFGQTDESFFDFCLSGRICSLPNLQQN